MTSKKILYVDDEIENLTGFKYQFKKEFQIFLANSASEGLRILKEKDVQIVISDQRMPGMTGIEFLKQVSEEYPKIVRLLLTGYENTITTLAALEQGMIYKCMSKPYEMNEMRVALLDAFAVYNFDQ